MTASSVLLCSMNEHWYSVSFDLIYDERLDIVEDFPMMYMGGEL